MLKEAIFKRFKRMGRVSGTYPCLGVCSFKAALLLAVLCMLMPSCVTQRACLKKYPPLITTDTTVVVRTEYKDTTVYVQLPAMVQADTVRLTLPCPEAAGYVSDTAKVDNYYAGARAWVSKGQLVVRLNMKDARLEFAIDSAIRLNSRTEVVTVKEVVKEKYVPAFYRASLFVNIFLLLFVGMLFYLSLRK